MTSSNQSRIPSLRKLSIAVLENLIKPVLGDAAIQEIKAPLAEKELRESLEKALANTEKRFLIEHNDAKLCDAILMLPLANLPAIANAVRAFYDRPTDSSFPDTLATQFLQIFPAFQKQRVDAAVSSYVGILRKELVSVSTESREKVSTLAALATQENTKQIADRLDQLARRLDSEHQNPIWRGNAPPLPSLVVGRERAIADLKARLGAEGNSQVSTLMPSLTIVRGWPGVGKTTLAATLAHDPDIAMAFPDGVLWASLGETPNLLSALRTWGRVLGRSELSQAQSLEEASAQLTVLLSTKRMLFIVDDVWEPEHAVPFKIGGQRCAMVITTRINIVAQMLAPTPNDIYVLPVLTDDKALELFRTLAPSVATQYPSQSLELIRELEGLPLALQVAGRMLNAEAEYGFGVIELLTELHEGTKLFQATAPSDRMDLATQTIPTVAILFKKSTDRLDAFTQDCFAYLGAFAPKPATFDLEAMTAVWQVKDAKPIARKLVDRGLLEYVPTIGRYQMHALLVTHAKSLLED